MIQEPVKKGLRMFRQSRVYRDHHHYRHYDRTELDRQTAAMLLTCWSYLTCWGITTVHDLLFHWEHQRSKWNEDVMPVCGRMFCVGDFVTFMLCQQEKEFGERLQRYDAHAEQMNIVELQEWMDELAHDVERDLQLAGFLAVTNEQIERRAMHAIQSI